MTYVLQHCDLDRYAHDPPNIPSFGWVARTVLLVVFFLAAAGAGLAHLQIKSGNENRACLSMPERKEVICYKGFSIADLELWTKDAMLMGFAAGPDDLLLPPRDDREVLDVGSSSSSSSSSLLSSASAFAAILVLQTDTREQNVESRTTQPCDAHGHVRCYRRFALWPVGGSALRFGFCCREIVVLALVAAFRALCFTSGAGYAKAYTSEAVLPSSARQQWYCHTFA